MRRPNAIPRQLLIVVSSLSFLSFSSSCDRTYSLVTDSQGIAPQIQNASLTPDSVNSDTLNVGPERKPEDILTYEVLIHATITHPSGENNIAAVSYFLFRSRFEPRITEGTMSDDGVGPDDFAHDSVFTGNAHFSLPRSEIGQLFVEIRSEDDLGFESNRIQLLFTLIRLNQPPVLGNLTAPDTVSVSSQPSFKITVQVQDPDGQDDILSVTRTTPSNLVLPLNDDGQNGDSMADDGIYTETVSLFPPPPVGSYTFTFKALDRSRVSSLIISKTIVVAP